MTLRERYEIFRLTSRIDATEKEYGIHQSKLKYVKVRHRHLVAM
jgi:hypothetical protein